MRKWLLLGAAIVVEVVATLALRASQDHSAWLVVVVAGYTGAFVFLTLVMRAGLPIGVAYGIWGALGTAGTAVLAAVIFGDPFTWPIAVGIVAATIGIRWVFAITAVLLLVNLIWVYVAVVEPARESGR